MNTPLETDTYAPQWQQFSDQELLEYYQSAGTDEVRAEQLFNVLYSRHAAPLWNYLRYRVSSREDAEDIFVDSWRIAIEELPDLTLKSSLRGWLLGIGRHTIASYYPRRRKGGLRISLFQPGTRRSANADYSLDELLLNLEGGLETLIETLHDPNEANNPVLVNLRQEEVTLLFGQVLPRLRERSHLCFDIIYLAYLAGLSNREIAVELKKSEGAIKTAKSRAHVYLAEILKELLERMDEGPNWFEELA